MAKPTHQILFLVPPEVQLLDLAGPAHVFYEAGQYGASVSLHYIGISARTEESTSSAGLTFSQIENFEVFELGEKDIVFVPGLEPFQWKDETFGQACQPFYAWLRQQQARGAKICSVCTGAYLLASAGMLDGKECTTHWKYISDFGKRFPKAILHKDRLFVKDGNTYSSAGVASGIDLSLFLLEELFGPVFATKVAKEIVVFLRRTESDPQLSVFLQYRNHMEDRIHQAQDSIAQHLDEPITIDQLAAQVHMSPRNLTRLFRKTTGITIGQYTDKLRLERAVQLLSEGEKVEAVSRSCGLSSSNQLRSLLKKYASVLPSDLS